MARKENQPAKTIDPTTDAHDELLSSAGGQVALVSQSMAAAFEDGKLLGQLETFNFITSIGETAIVSIYEKVKKSKTWAFLPNPSSDGRNFESLDEFCRAKLGKSYNRMQELVANRNAVTQELFEQSEKLGLRQADYNAIKALPLPDREAVQSAIADGSSREDVIAVLLDISGKVQTMSADLDGLRKNSDVTAKMLAERDEKIRKLTQKKLLKDPTEDDLLAHKARPLYELIAAAEILSTKLSGAVANVLNEQDDLLKAEAYNALTLITQYMLRAADENYMPLDMEAIGLDTGDFETKALGLSGLDTKEAN